jgi:cytochrome c oxidase assembly protein subunit 15
VFVLGLLQRIVPPALDQMHIPRRLLYSPVTLGLTIAAVLVYRAVDAPVRAQRAAVTLLGVEVVQAAIGFAQYFTGLPVVLVTLHLLGAALLSAAMTWLLLGVRERV